MNIGINKKVLSVFLALIALFAFGVFGAKAFAAEGDDAVTTDNYFTVYNGESEVGSDAELDGNHLVVALEGGQRAEFKRDLVLNDFEIVFAFAGKIDLIFSYDSHLATGNRAEEDGETVFNTEIENAVSIDGTSVSVNGETKTVAVTDNLYTVRLAVANSEESGYSFVVTVNGETFDISSFAELKPKMFGGNVTGSFSFAAGEEAAGDLSVDSIAQSTSDEEMKQDFVLAEGATEVERAKPVVLLGEDFYNSETDAAVVKRAYRNIDIVSAGYSVDETISASSFEIAVAEEFADDIAFNNESSTKTLRIKTADKNVQFSVVLNAGEETEESYTFELCGTVDETAPAVTANAEAIASYVKALYEATRATYETEDGEEEHYIRIGSGNYLDLPSMESLVKDGTTSYDDLDYTVYYRTRTSDWSSTTSFRIPVNSEGRYEFYVLFEDEDGNAMEQDEVVKDGDIIEGVPVFFAADEAMDAADIDVTGATNYVFSFEVYDDAPIEVQAPEESDIELAYKGISYTAAEFTVLANNYTEEYTLEYSATENGEYTVIPPLDELDEEEDEETYDQFAKYAYDGTRTFTPAETGYYRLTLTVYGSASPKDGSASIVINATSTPRRVVPNADNWFLNNIWSLVFLTIGTLALIGLIVVLCIKPKDAEAPAADKKSSSKNEKKKQ